VVLNLYSIHCRNSTVNMKVIAILLAVCLALVSANYYPYHNYQNKGYGPSNYTMVTMVTKTKVMDLMDTTTTTTNIIQRLAFLALILVLENKPLLKLQYIALSECYHI